MQHDASCRLSACGLLRQHRGVPFSFAMRELGHGKGSVPVFPCQNHLIVAGQNWRIPTLFLSFFLAPFAKTGKRCCFSLDDISFYLRSSNPAS